MTTASQLRPMESAIPKRRKVAPGRLFISGEWRDGRNGKTFETVDPTTEAVITQIAEATVEDVNEAVAAATAAMEGDWGRMSGHERGRILWLSLIHI